MPRATASVCGSSVRLAAAKAGCMWAPAPHHCPQRIPASRRADITPEAREAETIARKVVVAELWRRPY